MNKTTAAKKTETSHPVNRADYKGSEKYKDAVEAHSKALKEYKEVRDAYRALKVDDATFLVALAKKEDADRAFDAAYATEKG